MAHLQSKFQSVKQDWETPAELFEPLHLEFGFTVDLAAASYNAKLPRYFTKEIDALSQSWAGERCWLNPPYGDGTPLCKWVERAYNESKRGALVVMLIPARTNTNWFHDYCLAHGEVRFIKGRPKFVGAPHGLPQPLCLVIFRPDTQ